MAYAMAGSAPEEARIRRLWPSDIKAYRAHLLRLEEEARYSRFGTVVSPHVVADHANVCFGADTLVFGAFAGGEIRGGAELHLLDPHAPFDDREAEAAFSVEKSFRHGGLGSALVERLMLAARNRGIRALVISCLPQNFAMQQLAKKYGAKLSFEADEVTGKIRVEWPTPQTILAEFVEDSLDFATALVDLQRRVFPAPARAA